MQNLLLLAELEALGVCPCRFLLLWQDWRHWARAHADFIPFGRTGGIGRVPPIIYYFWQDSRHWACAHAELIAFGRTEGIGRVPMQNLLLLAELEALGVCPCRIY